MNRNQAHTDHKSPRIVRVFVASPGDVSIERNRVEMVIEELNRDFGDTLEVRLECIRWEKYVSPMMGRPEEVVLQQVKLNEWDIFIGILWLKFGTPTGELNPSTEREYLSGTEEEFTLAYNSWQKTGSPQILFYRCTRPPESVLQLEAEQYLRVSDFFHRFNVSKEHPGIVRPYHSVEEFERRLREDLAYVVRALAPKEATFQGPLLNSDHQSQGFLRLYLPSANEERNAMKRAALKDASNITLLAHSGYSYLAAVGHRFRQELKEGLERGATFRATLTNPWSVTGLFIALGEIDPTLNSDVRNVYQTGDLSQVDPVLLIESTTWYSIKFRDSMTGYKQLADRYGGQMEVRFTQHEMPATILLTNLEAFFEPYLHIDLQERLQMAMLTFEVQIHNQSHLYRHAQSYFDFLWNTGKDYRDFTQNEMLYKDQLKAHLRK